MTHNCWPHYISLGRKVHSTGCHGWIQYVKFSFQVCTKRYWLAESQVRLAPGASDRCVCGHWTELRGSLYSIRHLWGFAAVEQKRMLMPNCWQRKEQRHCYICRLLLLPLVLLQSLPAVQYSCGEELSIRGWYIIMFYLKAVYVIALLISPLIYMHLALSTWGHSDFLLCYLCWGQRNTSWVIECQDKDMHQFNECSFIVFPPYNVPMR